MYNHIRHCIFTLAVIGVSNEFGSVCEYIIGAKDLLQFTDYLGVYHIIAYEF